MMKGRKIGKRERKRMLGLLKEDFQMSLAVPGRHGVLPMRVVQAR